MLLQEELLERIVEETHAGFVHAQLEMAQTKHTPTIAARAAELYYLANASASLHAALGGWMSNDAMERKASRCTRSVIEYGLLF